MLAPDGAVTHVLAYHCSESRPAHEIRRGGGQVHREVGPCREIRAVLRPSCKDLTLLEFARPIGKPDIPAVAARRICSGPPLQGAPYPFRRF